MLCLNPPVRAPRTHLISGLGRFPESRAHRIAGLKKHMTMHHVHGLAGCVFQFVVSSSLKA